MPDSTMTTEKKTPADFTREAAEYHESLDAARKELSAAQSRLDAATATRNRLVSEAGSYGYTAAYARTLLRKA
jgi:outer membrane protein TolC